MSNTVWAGSTGPGCRHATKCFRIRRSSFPPDRSCGSSGREGYRERRDIWVEACQRLGVDRDTIMHATDGFLFLDFLLRNTDRHYNNFGLIRDVESFAIRPAPIYDSGASLWNGMDPRRMDNGDYRTKPFWTDQWGEEDNAYWQLSLIDDWDRYDLSVLETCPTSSTNSFPPTSASPPCSSTGSRACCVAGSRSSDVKGTPPPPAT